MTDQGRRFGDNPSRTIADPGLAQALALVRGILERPGYAFRDGELVENLRALRALAGAADAAKLMFVAELGLRPEAVPGVFRGSAAMVFLTEGLNQSRGHAARDVAAAAAIASASPELPVMGQALADGEVSREHLDVAVSTLRRIPKALKTKVVADEDGDGRTGGQVIDAILTEQARTLPPTTIERLGRQILHRLDPDRAERFDADAFERRSCTVTTDDLGMGRYALTLEPVTHLLVHAAITRRCAPRPTGHAVTSDGEVVEVKDTRSSEQRRADAVADLILAGAGTRPTGNQRSADATASEPEQPRQLERAAHDEQESQPPKAVDVAVPSTEVEITVIATVDQVSAAFGVDDPAARAAGLARLTLAGNIGAYPGATLHPQVLARLACDSPIRRILLDNNGAVLHHGRARRLASPAQKRALAVRDGGCVIPGCPAPPEWSDAHHVTPWDQGGTTDIDTMVLLCSRHHTAHHAGVYNVRMHDGIPWVQVPGWQHPGRPWLRNHSHDHHELADGIAAELKPQPYLPWGEPRPWTTPHDAA